MSARGKYVKRKSRRLRAPGKVTLKMPLSRRGLSALRAHHRVRVRVRVTLVPSRHGLATAAASTAATFKH